MSAEGVADFDALHSRTADDKAVALGDDIRRRPLIERKTALKWVLRRPRGGIQYVDHTEGDGEEMFAVVCKLGLEGIVSKKLSSGYKSGPSKAIQSLRLQHGPLTERFDRDTLCHWWSVS